MREFLEFLKKELKIVHAEDWNRVSRAQVDVLGGTGSTF